MELTNMVFDPQFTNRDESGLETNIDGYQTEWDSDLGIGDTSKPRVIYKTNEEELEHEPDLEQ